MSDIDWKTKEKEALLGAILALKNKDEAKRFIRDLLTREEIEEVSKRLLAARMLTEGSSYRDVEKATGFSSTTVARVSKWLQGSLGGYRLIISRMHHHTPSLMRRGLS